MGTMLDAFNTDAFNTVSMSAAIDKLPPMPRRIGQLGIFGPKPVDTLTILVEERDGVLELIASQPRGGPGTPQTPVKRKVRSFPLSHFPTTDQILADDVQGKRAFGSENRTEVLISKVNEKLQRMRNNLEATREWMMAGALAGVVKDGDGTTTLINLFTEFGTTQQTVDFLMGSADMRDKTLDVVEAIEVALGAATFDHVHALCSKVFFRKFIQHADVKEAYARWRDGAFLRSDPRAGFPFADVIFEQYNAIVGSTPFIASGDVRFFPVGVPDLFQAVNGPADYIETVNTLGQEFYAKQERMPMDKGINLEAQTNTMMMCNRPRCLVRGHTST